MGPEKCSRTDFNIGWGSGEYVKLLLYGNWRCRVQIVNQRTLGPVRKEGPKAKGEIPEPTRQDFGEPLSFSRLLTPDLGNQAFCCSSGSPQKNRPAPGNPARVADKLLAKPKRFQEPSNFSCLDLQKWR